MNYFHNGTLDGIICDTFSLWNPLTKARYRNPALTKKCKHHKACFEYEEILQKMNHQQHYQCPHCNQQAFSPVDLVQDWRVQAYKEFNEEVDEVTIIKGIMVNKYWRNTNRYLNFFAQSEYNNQFNQIFERARRDTSIVSLIERDLKQYGNKVIIKQFFGVFVCQLK